jgi:hypothetical protein
MPPAPIPRSKTWLIRRPHDPQAIMSAIFSFAFGVAVMYISIFLHTLMYKDVGQICNLTSLHPQPQRARFRDSG